MFHHCHQPQSYLSEKDKKAEMYKCKCSLKIDDGLSFIQAAPANRRTDVLFEFCSKIKFLNPPTWILKVRHLINVLV